MNLFTSFFLVIANQHTIKTKDARLGTNNIDTGLLGVGVPNFGQAELCYQLMKYLNFYTVADDLICIIQMNDAYQVFVS